LQHLKNPASSLQKATRITTADWKGASDLVFFASRDVADASQNAADAPKDKIADLELHCGHEVNLQWKCFTREFLL